LELKVSLTRTSFLSVLALTLICPVRGEELLVATVKSTRGNSSILRGQNSIPIQEGTHILLNDTLRTAPDGQLGVILQDGTRLSLGPNTELKVDRFVYEPADGKFGLILSLARGALAYVSGKIAQFSPGSVSVETPVGILGLRGTEFAVSLAEQ
jgi:hypothetical protein